MLQTVLCPNHVGLYPIVRDPVTLTTIHKGNCNMLPRESILSQLGKKSGVPKEDKGVWGSQGERVWNSQGGRKDKCFFLHTLVRIQFS